MLALASGAALANGTLPAGKYYQNTINKTCTGANVCLLQFPVIVADKVLYVSSVGCTVTLSGSGPSVGIAWLYSSKGDATIFLQPVLMSSDQQSRTFLLQHEGDFFLSPAAEPRILVGGSATAVTAVAASCSLIGRLSTP